MKLSLTLFLAAAAALALFPVHGARADDARAREIMQMVNDRYDGDTGIADQEMILIDKRGNERVRRIRTFEKEFGKDSRRIMFFQEPPDVKDTAFLTYDYDESGRDDDQWLYLPALKKVKRIASSEKDGSFMGSDFTYGDMTTRELSKYTFKILDEKVVRGQKTWVIEALPISGEVVDEFGYTKSVVFVRQDNYVVVRGVFWLNKGDKVKYLDVPDIREINGVWTSMEMHMKTQQGDR
ncbi:MAG: outer membrane lipoprotein-sorting protein, partial [Pseudomonadota bacterium]